MSMISSAAVDMDSQRRDLLPMLAIPLKYFLEIRPNFDTSSFEGTVRIGFRAFVDTRELYLHSVGLDIMEVTMQYGNKRTDIKYRALDNTLVLDLPQLICRLSNFDITIRYSGPFAKGLEGLYQSSYDEVRSKQKILATHLEPNHARRVFPCIDEPDKKAKFIISVTARDTDHCLSNMPLVSRESIGDGKILACFAESELMSTYLVALVVGRLKSITATSSRIPITLYATPGQELNGQHALEVAVKGLGFYENVFDSRYPLPKLDLVAIPDLGPGAMENWGLITFRPVELLLETSGSGLARRQRVTEVVLHEISHQWFGNLVTMKYWDSLWLKEGFATWMAKFAMNKFYPQWHVWQDFVADSLQQGLELDALHSSHPVERLVKNASEAGQAFDSIAYRKGSSVLRMLVQEIGEDKFLEGIKLYLEKYKYENATSNDLWDTLSQASSMDVNSKMNFWINRVGFPVVIATESPENASVRESGIILSQRRFFATEDNAPEEDVSSYPLVISMRTIDTATETFTFDQPEMRLRLPENSFYKINIDHTGFYRTAYPTSHLRSLGEAAGKGLLSTEDKVGIIADAVALAAAGYQQTSGLFDLFQGLKMENEYLVWSQMAKALKSIRTAWRFQSPQAVRGLTNFAADIFGPKAISVGWTIEEGDDETMQLLKPLLLDAAGSSGVNEVIDDVLGRFKQYSLGNKDALHPDTRDMAFGIALANGGESVFDAVLRLYKKSSNEEERFCLLGNLGCVNQAATVQKVLALPFTETAIRNSDVYLLFWCLNESSEGARGLWKWATSHWDILSSELSSRMLRIVVKLMICGFSTQGQIKEVRDFFLRHDTIEYEQVLAQEMEKVEGRAKWAERDTANVEEWLQTNGYISQD